MALPPGLSNGTLARADLVCEMMSWQAEQLGDGTREEFLEHGCDWKGVAARGGRDFGGRLYGVLAQQDLPPWAAAVSRAWRPAVAEL